MPCSSTPARIRCSKYSPAAGLEHVRVDALEVQQVREQQARRAGADDPDLRLFPQLRSLRGPGEPPRLPGIGLSR